nr:hypothetical protein [uncultured Dysosmobacter sp.]
MEPHPEQNRVLSPTGPVPRRGLSCLIGHLFTALEPPCDAPIVGEVTITGTTRSGQKGTLAATGGAFTFSGDPEDLIAASRAVEDCRGPCALRPEEGADNA